MCDTIRDGHKSDSNCVTQSEKITREPVPQPDAYLTPRAPNKPAGTQVAWVRYGLKQVWVEKSIWLTRSNMQKRATRQKYLQLFVVKAAAQSDRAVTRVTQCKVTLDDNQYVHSCGHQDLACVGSWGVCRPVKQPQQIQQVLNATVYVRCCHSK